MKGQKLVNEVVMEWESVVKRVANTTFTLQNCSMEQFWISSRNCSELCN